jgi:hypothetical protein
VRKAVERKAAQGGEPADVKAGEPAEVTAEEPVEEKAAEEEAA